MCITKRLQQGSKSMNGNPMSGQETKSTTIANKLEEEILSKKYQAGENLPSQHELADQFNASTL